MTETHPSYLGDGVYASFDGYQIWLKTEPTRETINWIALEPSVFFNLLAYSKVVWAAPEAPSPRSDMPAAPPAPPSPEAPEATIAKLREVLAPLLLLAENNAVQIEGEWGCCRTIGELEEQGDLCSEILNARAVLAETSHE